MPNRRQKGKALRTISKRMRGLLVVLIGAAVIGFVVLPLWINGYLFEGQSVYAAGRANAPIELTAPPTITPAPTPMPETTPEIPVAPQEVEIEDPEPLYLQNVGQYSLLKHEDEDPAVKALQERLMELGYFDYDEPTAYYGTVTRDGVKMVQRVLGIEQTGEADPALQALLFSDEMPAYCIRQGDEGSDVRGMQVRLHELDYYEDMINGYFGVATKRAVTQFQKRNKLPETGEVDHDMRELLYSSKARYLVDPTPTPTIKPTPKPKPTATPKTIGEDDIPIVVPTPKPKATPKGTMFGEEHGSYTSGASGLIAAAKAQLGRPYVWGGTTPDDGFDCSGLVYYSLKQAGVSVGRKNAISYSTYSQWEAVGSLAECRAGDLLFYKSDDNPNVNHTGIYLGNGSFVHASSSQEKVVISQCSGYYQRNFIVARRVF